MKVTFYHRPNGRTEVLEITKVIEDDANWFLENGIKVSMEDDGTGNGFIIYGDTGQVDEEGEPVEVIVFSLGRGCEKSLSELRRLCEVSIGIGG